MVDKMKNQSSYQPAGLMRKLNNSEYELRKHFEKNNIKLKQIHTNGQPGSVFRVWHSEHKATTKKTRNSRITKWHYQNQMQTIISLIT